MIDGCSPMSAFFRVVVPLTIPAVTAVGILGFIRAWNDVLFASVLSNDKQGL